MKIKDIIYRANRNIKNDKKRSLQLITTVFLASLVIMIVFCLGKFSGNLLTSFNENKDELTTIKIWGVEHTKSKGLVDALTSDRASVWSYYDAKKIVDDFDSSLGRAYIAGQLLGDFSHLEDEEDIFPATQMGINIDELYTIDDFYMGGRIKDTKGAIVTRKFIESAVSKENYKKRDYSDLKTKDIIGKTLDMTINRNVMENGESVWKEIKVLIRIDGVIENEKNIYTNAILGLEEDKEKVFNGSAILIPMERIEILDKEYGLEYPFSNSEIVISAHSIDNMDAIIEKIEETPFLQTSEYKSYTTFKYLNFLLQIIFGILGVSVIVSSVIGIINMMFISFRSNIDEIKILNFLGINLKDLKMIYIFELGIMIGYGIILSMVPLIFIKYLRNMIFELVFINIIFGVCLCIICILPCIISIDKLKKASQ
ncbi:MAG: hypothetical protein ACRC6T_01745 [Sarcina sp.]